jgi:hypothetical protein
MDLTARDIERFWSKVERSEGCWSWSGSHFKTTSYALFNLKMPDGVWRPTVAHRAAYTIVVGPIPEGLVIDHLCRNRACVNPAHMEAVTRGENVLRGEGPSALEARQTECKRGHPFSEENTYRKPGTNKRECRVCQRAREATRRPRRKSA